MHLRPRLAIKLKCFSPCLVCGEEVRVGVCGGAGVFAGVLGVTVRRFGFKLAVLPNGLFSQVVRKSTV